MRSAAASTPGRKSALGSSLLPVACLVAGLCASAALADILAELPAEPAALDALLEGLAPERREAALSDLIERLRGVEDEAGFNRAAAGWIEDLKQPVPPQATLLEVMTQSRIVEVGNPEDPVVYMLTDPLCMPCGRALEDAIRQVEAGAISLRIVLAPLTSADSHGVIAGILAQQDPLEALLAIGDAETAIPFSPYAYLDGASQEALAFNRAIATSGAIEQIPLFARATGRDESYALSLASLAGASGGEGTEGTDAADGAEAVAGPMAE